MNSPLLVTGAGGRIGRRLRARLDADGIDAAYTVSAGGASSAGDSADAIDLTDPQAIRDLLARRAPRAIIHLAAVSGAACDADPERARAVNVASVEQLLGAARDAGVERFVLASTSAVYGDQYESPVIESGPLAPASEYARTKAAAELITTGSADAAAGLSTVVLRIFNVYGPGMDDALPNRLMAATEHAPAKLTGLDEFVRDYLHVDDLVEALIRASSVELPTSSVTLNVGSGRATSNRELVAALEPVWFTAVEPRVSYSCADIGRARAILELPEGRPLRRDTVLT